MKEIQLSKQGKNKGKYVALVDDEDFERVNHFRWQVSIEKCTEYARTRMPDSKQVYMHQFILGNSGGDHIDSNGLNNQKTNLRLCTHRQNIMNKKSHKNSSSIYKGVSWNKQHKRWVANIYSNKSLKRLGFFKNEIDAAKAYNKKALELFGEFAKLNIIST